MITCFIDGCCEPFNPGGMASYGIAVLRDGLIIHEASKLFLPISGKEKETSNNVAEYLALQYLLEWLINQNLNKESIEVRSDSMLVIKQMWGNWRIKQGLYVPIARGCRELVKQFPDIHGWWIPREENSMADKLSKEVLLKAGVIFRIQPDRQRS